MDDSECEIHKKFELSSKKSLSTLSTLLRFEKRTVSATSISILDEQLPYLFVYKSENFVPNMFQKLKGATYTRGCD